MVDCGSDFPPELRETIATWDTGVLIRETPDRLTTRGWNGYGENEHRGMLDRADLDVERDRMLMLQPSVTPPQNYVLTTMRWPIPSCSGPSPSI